MKELARAYEPQDIEQRLYREWLERGDFRADADDPAEPYCIMIPPPNVTGYLHMGHALVNTLQDVLVRHARMKGLATLWQPGTDHAGIATQLVVERKLAAQGTTKEDLGREGFEAEVWKWKEQHGSGILNQLERLGASCDWSRTRFTLDEGLSRAVRKVFVELHRRGKLYRGPYMVSWCPRCDTALSDLEVEHEEREGRLWSFAYPLADGSGEIVVATTRPETMLGDTAVAVHPDDERYASLVGRTLTLPLVEREIPIVADAHVEKDFGSGAVKVTPAHDPNDWEIGKRHELELVQVIAADGTMTEASGRFAGLERFEARKAVLAALDEAGLRRGEKPHVHSVGTCQRCATAIEPLVSRQWFVTMKPMAERALAAVADGRTRIQPDRYRKIFENWLGEIRDWCISRQLWWGHRIPAWDCADCQEIVVAEEDPTECPKCGGTALEQDPDVLDTWFSSALWPFSTLGWPEETKDLEKWYPTSVLVTGFDIIFFWVARMMMFGLEVMDEVPFHDVFLHGLVRDAKGEKMSKVKGNVIDPLDVIDSHGADPLRFTLAIMAVPARDIPWNPQRMEGYRTFANKLWQAARFVQMNVSDDDVPRAREAKATGDPGGTDLDEDHLDEIDRWILARLDETCEGVERALSSYRFHEAADLLYHFVWDEYCAWYIEAAKPALAEGADPARAATRRSVLLRVLDDSLRMLHPFMPFMTEEVWRHFPAFAVTEGGVPTIQRAAWPRPSGRGGDAPATLAVERLQAAVSGVRTLRAETGIDPKQRLPVTLVVPAEDARATFEKQAAVFAALARTQPPEVVAEADAERREGCAVAEGGGASILVPLAGVLDVDAEKQRLAAQVEKTDEEIEGLAKRLGNASFVEKAPPEVVEETRSKHAELEERRERLERTLRALSA